MAEEPKISWGKTLGLAALWGCVFVPLFMVTEFWMSYLVVELTPLGEPWGMVVGSVLPLMILLATIAGVAHRSWRVFWMMGIIGGIFGSVLALLYVGLPAVVIMTVVTAGVVHRSWHVFWLTGILGGISAFVTSVAMFVLFFRGAGG